MNCPKCGGHTRKPKPGTVWFHCEQCSGWFLWDRPTIGGMILDVLETSAGFWFTQQELISDLCLRRPGLKPDSIRRSLRILKLHGGGLASDRLILSTSSGGERLGPKRTVGIEWRMDGELLKLRVADRNL